MKSWTEPLALGKYVLKNRVMLSAMTRMRCDPATGIPNDLLVQYYGQRSGAGLCLTQCSSWSPRGVSYPGAGEIYNKEQAQGWKKVTAEVHKNGGRIYLQMYHSGRATHPKLNGGFQSWSSSAVAINYDKIYALGGAEYPVPKQMTIEEIEITKQQFQNGVKLAKSAEFDGIQLHGANGYLIDQFIRSNSNKRTDIYGGSVEKRARFALELIDIALKHFEPYQIGIKFSPVGRYNDMFDENPVETYSYILQQLDKRNIGFVEFMESVQVDQSKASEHYISGKKQIQNLAKTFRPFFKGLLYDNQVASPEVGLQKIQEGQCDGVSFARLFITNPDLPQRLAHGYELNRNLDYKTFYGAMLEDKAKGYIDYPNYQKGSAL